MGEDGRIMTPNGTYYTSKYVFDLRMGEDGRITTPNKYHAKKSKIDGILFDSHAEAMRYAELKLMKQAGIVKNIECQPVFELQRAYRRCPACKGRWGIIHEEQLSVNVCPICKTKTPLTRSIVYRADFRITYADGHQEIEDVKGMETALFKLKRKLFEYKFPELTLKIVKGRR
jgi:hypothetical protein